MHPFQASKHNYFVLKIYFYYSLLCWKYLSIRQLFFFFFFLRVAQNWFLGRSYDGCCNKNIKIELCIRLSICDYSMLITLYKIGELHFRLLGTNGFHVKAKNERYTAASLGCCQNLKNFNMKISRCRLADYIKKLHQKACRTCSTIIFLHSTNEIIDLWHCHWRCRHQIINSLLSYGQLAPA